MKTHKIVVLGGGTAGMMASTFIKNYWGDKVEVIVVYDHSNPGIGVGESLTPIFIKFLKSINVPVSDLIKKVNSTFKLGLKFKNWNGDGSYYYHPFSQIDNAQDIYNYTLTSSIINNTDKLFSNEQYIFYDSYYFENSKIPFDVDTVLGQYSLHIDATLFSKYLQEKFQDRLTIKNKIISDVEKDDKGHIKSLICSDGDKIEGDFFIDASGFQRVLFKHIGGNKWNDMKDWLPLDRCIPNPVFLEFDKIPTCTTSEASSDGWILQVPLQNRWGAGYLYSSQFTTDEQAFDKFSDFVRERYNQNLNNTSRVLKFDSGYWEEQWVGNCLSVGLSCGFSEPLEATNIHQIIHQLGHFIQMYNFEVNPHDVNYYNKISKVFFENIYLYLRFCYCGGRDDSEFWKYISNHEPLQITELKNKISKEIVNSFNLDFGTPFNYNNFTLVANGLGLIDKEKYKKIIEDRMILANSRASNEHFNNYKSHIQHNYSVDHLTFITAVKISPDEILKE